MTFSVILNLPVLSFFVQQWRKLLDALFAPSQRTVYLSIFRVYVSFHIAKKVIFAWPYLEMLYGRNSFLVWSNENVFTGFVRDHYILANSVYLFSALMMMFGIGRRWTVLVVYLCQELMNYVNGYTLDGGDNLLKFGLLYLMFANSFHYLALYQRKMTKPWQIRLDNLLTNLAVLALVLHLCLAYFISGFSKIHADVWYKGTAVYYTFLNERFMGTHWNKWIVQNSFFVTASTYGAMIWETAFPFLIINRAIRVPVLIVGAMLHIGIYIFMMINAFQIYFISLYGFFFTDSEIRRFLHALSKRFKKLRWLEANQGIFADRPVEVGNL